MGSLEAHEKRMSRFFDHTLEQAFQSKVSFKEKKYMEAGNKNSRGGFTKLSRRKLAKALEK